MTSTNDEKNVKSNHSSSSKGKSYYIELYKSLDGRLSGEGNLRDRTQHLCEAWRRIHSLCQHSAPSTHPHLLSWLQRHTARTILQTEWQKPESKPHHGKLSEAIEAFIEESQQAISGRNGAGPSWESQLLQRAEWFKNVLSNPWGHPILRLLSNPTGEKPSDREVLEWLKEERGVMFVTRLRQLATAKTCVDIACALVVAVMDRVRASVGNTEEDTAAASRKKEPTFGDTLKTEAGFTLDVWELLTDLEFVLLFKEENRSRCIELAKQTPLRSGYQLVERLHSRLETSPREKKLWKNAKEVATLIAQVVIARCMVVPVCTGVARTALYCCTRSLVRLLTPKQLPTAASALAAPAATARHLHTLAAAVDAQSNNQMKPFVCELYVRAITTGMNELERLKLKVEKESEARSAEQTLSSWFTQLGTLLSKSSRLNYECTLTAFSVHPSPAMYERILAAPLLPPPATSAEKYESIPEATSDFGSWATDSRTMTNFVKTSETLNIKQIQYNTNILSTAVLSEGEGIGLEAELCQDLAVLLSGPRHKTLSWDMNRDLLLENCRIYMERTNGGTRALTTELKYLNLDPRSFQHLPEEEEDEDNIYYGIEKGYEHLVEFQEAEHIWQNAFDDSVTEETFSSGGFDEVTSPVRRKKKRGKKAKILSDTEIDPLGNYIADQQYEKKKERPHSKERSNKLLQTGESEIAKEEKEPTSVMFDKKMQNKARKERKKRDKGYTVHEPKVGSLSRLIGMKVARVENLPAQLEKQEPQSNEQTDNTNQRKLSVASLNSDGSDTNVVFDGLYSMDEIKSPEKSFQSFEKSNYKSALFPLTGVSEIKPELHDKYESRKTDSANVQNSPQTNNSQNTFSSSSSNTIHSVTDTKLDNNVSQGKQLNEDVKQNIKKLIEFRKFKYGFDKKPSVHELDSYSENLRSFKNNTASLQGSIVKEVKDSVLIKPNPVIILNTSKHSLINSKCKQLTSLKGEGNNSIDKSHMGNMISHHTERSYVGAVVTGLARYTNSINEIKEKVNEKQPLSCTESYKLSSKKKLENESLVEDKEASIGNTSINKQNVSNDTSSIFEDFLRELKETINAGAITDKTKMQTSHKPTNPDNKIMASPSDKHLKVHSAYASQCAKPLVQQKKADVPNTFARLNYMHRNKHSDLRPKLPTCPTKKSEKPPSEFKQLVSDHNLNKFNYLQSKGNLTISRLGNTHQNKKPNGHVAIHKNVRKEPTCMSNISQAKVVTTHNIATKTQSSKEFTNDTSKYPQVVSQTSFLAEKDQHDLLLLLRQQSKLNAVKSGVKPESELRHIAQVSLQSNTENNSNMYSDSSLTGLKIFSRSEACKSKPPEASASSNNSLLKINQEKLTGVSISGKEINSPSFVMYKAHTSSCKKNRQLKGEGKTPVKKEPGTHKFSMENYATKQDWESVMDAILKHKTPRRGLNALEIALNKDSFEQRLKENKISSQKGELLNVDNKEREMRNNEDKCQKIASHFSTTPISFKSIRKNAVTSLQKPIIVNKSDGDYLPKLNAPELSKDIVYNVINNDDPFISGIQNSDYDLLEELMDDDLKKEIGELLSDEEAFSPVCLKKEKESDIETKPKIVTTPLQKYNYSDTITTQEAKVFEYQNARTKDIKNQNSQGTETTKTVEKKQKHTEIPMCAIQQSFENDCNFKTPTVSAYDALNKTVITSHINVSEIPKISHRQSTVQDKILYKSPNEVLGNKRNESSIKTQLMDSKISNKDIQQTLSTNNSFHSDHENTNFICKSRVPDKSLENVVAPEIDSGKFAITPAETTLSTRLRNNHPVAVNINIALLQSTHFSTPVVTPNIIDKASTVLGPQSHSLQRLDISTVNFDQPDTNNSKRSGISVIKQVPIPEHQHVSNVNLKNNSDIVMNENSCEMKMLNVNSNASKLDRFVNRKQRIISQVSYHNSYEKINKRLCSTLDQTVEDNGDDLQIIKESERLKQKRWNVMNRKISHKIGISPIPLTYVPLKVIKLKPAFSENTSVDTNNDQLKQRNIKIETKLDIKEEIFPRNSKNSCIKNIEKPLPNLLDVKVADKCTEIKSSKSFCRHIRLRSTNKFENDIFIFNKNSVIQEKVGKIKSKFKFEKSFVKDTNKLEDSVLSNNMNKTKSELAESLIIKDTISKDVIKQKNYSIHFTENKNNTTTTAINNGETINKDDNVLEAENIISVNNVDTSMDKQFFDVEDKLITSVIRKLNKPISDLHALEDIAMIMKTSDNNEEKENLINKFQTDMTSRNDQSHIKLREHKEEMSLQNNLNEHAQNHEVHYSNKNIDQFNYTNNSTLKNSADTNVSNGQVTITEGRVMRKKLINQSKLITNFSPVKKCVQNIRCKLNEKNSASKNIRSNKKNITFKEITLKTKNPNNKTFRLKLPNGKHVRATITGNNNYNVNNILSHPDLKRFLLNDSFKSGKCTFRKIPGANCCVLDIETAQNLSKKKKSINTQEEMETINLISDDEDDPASSSDGKHVFVKSLLGQEASTRQKKLSGNCLVSLARYTPEQLLALVEKKKDTEPTELEKHHNLKVPISAVSVNTEEYANSSFSNQGISNSKQTENCNSFTCKDDNSSSPLATEISITECYASDLKNLASETLPTDNQYNEETIEIAKDKQLVTDSIEISKQKSNNVQCYLKLTRCDNLVKKYEKFKALKQECFIDLVRCDDNSKENVNSTMSSLHLDSSSSVESSAENVYCIEGNDNVHCKYLQSNETFNCSSESSLVRSDSYSILNDFSVYSNVTDFTYEKTTDEHNHKNDFDPSKIQTLVFIKCDAEWTMTKQQAADCKYNDKVSVRRNNQSDTNASTNFEKDKYCCTFEKCKDLKKCLIETITGIEVPSLKKLVLKLFENTKLIDVLQPISSKNILIMQKRTHFLKRKMICHENVLPSSCKIFKVNSNLPLKNESLSRKINATKPQANSPAHFVKTSNKIFDAVLPTSKYQKNYIVQKNTRELCDVAELPERILHFDTKFKGEYSNTIYFNETLRSKNDYNHVKKVYQCNTPVNKMHNEVEKHDLEDGYFRSQGLIKNDSVTNIKINVVKVFDNNIMQPVKTRLSSLQMKFLNTIPTVNNQFKKKNLHNNFQNIFELFVGDNNNEKSFTEDNINNIVLADFRREGNTFKYCQNEIESKNKNKSEINLNQDNVSTERNNFFLCNIKEPSNLTPELFERQDSKAIPYKPVKYGNTEIMNEINSLATSQFIDEAGKLDKNKSENGNKTLKETNKKVNTPLNNILSNANFAVNETISLNLDHDYDKATTLSDLNYWRNFITSKNKCKEVSKTGESINVQHSVTISNVEKDTIEEPPAVQKEQKTTYDILHNVTLICKDNSEVVLKGIEYEDPIAGTCYMFPLETNTDFSEKVNDVDNICDGLSNNDYHTQTILDKNKDNTLDDENFSIMIPKKTYSRFYKLNKNNYENLGKKAIKRKSNFQDFKTNEKRYRKSKNIDYLNNNASIQKNLTYSKEFKRLCNYYNTLKFSFSRSFHKEYIDVSNMIKCWPVRNTLFVPSNEEIDNIFEDNYELKYFPDPTKQTLVEELSENYTDIQSEPLESNETIFNMGFGEESGRVIQNLENKDVYPKFSAATLSDVKQSQPFLLSEDYADCENTYEISDFNSTKEDQKKKLKHYITYIQLRDKVRSFFKKTTLELKYSWIRDNLKDNDLKWKFNGKCDSTNNPFDFYVQDFIEPMPLEAVVQVVQVGQLPVSAAAQNPMTCDPRVTHVSNASPPQCSMESSMNDDSQSAIKTEYTELTTADLTIPLVAEYEHREDKIKIESDENTYVSNNEISIQFESEFIPKIEPKEEKYEPDEESSVHLENKDLQLMGNNHEGNSDYPYNENINTEQLVSSASAALFYDSSNEQNGTFEKTDQIAHAMNAAGIIPTAENDSISNSLVNTLSPKQNDNVVNTTLTSEEEFAKTSSINALALQHALAQILPPPLNQTNNIESDQKTQDSSVPQQVLHIIQGKNASGNQITLVESSVVDSGQQSVINTTSATPVLHIVQNKSSTSNTNSDESSLQHTNSFGGFSLVDTGLQQGTNQLLHIVNTGNQKSNNTNQFLKRVNLLTNLTNVQGSNEQKMLQFVCKSADGKAIQLNAPHQRGMVLRLQPIESQNIQSSPSKNDDHSPTPTTTHQESSEDIETAITQQEIKSRSVYEENYAKFIQNTSNHHSSPESTTSLPKFNQAFGKPVFQDGPDKQNEINSNSTHLSSVNSDNSECETCDNAMNLDHIGQINSPPLLLRKSPQNSQAQPDLVQQIKQTITPMNIQTMHGGVIYTRQIPVNIGGGQTINLITVPTTELIDDSNQKQSDIKFVNHGDMVEPSIIKIVPPNQSTSNSELSHEEGNNARPAGDNGQNTQPQPILTQMRIKLPMLSKTPQMVTGARVVRPSFFQIQRNVIGGTNQPVYQQLVLTAAPPLGQQTIRLPQAQINKQVKVPTESSESQMSSSTLEQLREFDMVLEQVKERSTVQPNSTTNNTTSKLHTSSSDAIDGGSTGVTTEPTQVLYSIGKNQQFNVAYVNRKSTVTTSANSTFVRSPDSSGITETPTSATQVQLPQTVTTDTKSNETQLVQQNPPKPKISSKSRSRPKASSNTHNTLKLNNVPPKTSSQKPFEDEQTTQRILYILAEYKEQVENSPDKDKPAPRRRTNPPTPGSSKRKKSHSRRPGARDMSPIHGDDTCRTMGSEDSSCGTSQGDCNENCLDVHSPQDSPRKVVKKLSFEQETPPIQHRPQPPRNVIVADGQTITVARGTTGKPTTAVLMPGNYILPVSVVKGGQQIAIVTNRGPKLLTVAGPEGGTTNALLLQRLIGPAGLKPVLARPGVRHVRLPTASLHNLQAFNLATTTTVQPPDSTASSIPPPNPPDLVETKASASPWPEKETQEVIKPVREASPHESEPWNVPSSANVHDYTYEETVRTDNLDRTVLEPIPNRYSPDMEAQRIFDKMFDVDSKKSFIDSQDESPRCDYDIDASECDDKCYHQVMASSTGDEDENQVVQKNISSQRQHRLTHVSAAALRHKYAILEHELRLQKSLSEECEDLGVDSPSASELFPEAELLFAGSPAHEQTQDHTTHRTHTPQPTILSQGVVPRSDIDDQIATDHLLQRNDIHDENNDLDVNLGLDDVGIVTVTENGATITLDQEEFARSHPNTTFHSEEPVDDGEMQPYTITGIKGPHITSTIFHANRAPATVLMGPQTTVISQATHDNPTIQHNIKYSHIDNIINTPSTHQANLNLSSVRVKDDGLTRFDSILTDSRELHLSNTASAIVHSHNATQVIRRVCYDDDKRESRYLMNEQDALIAGDDTKMNAEDSSRDATLESIAGDVDDYRSSPERQTELYWESNSTSERSESRRPLDFSSDSDKCCKSPSYDETNSTDSSGVGAHMRLDSVIKDARGIDRSGSADGSSADDTHPPLRTYPAKRLYHSLEGATSRSLTGKTRAGERSPDSLEIRRRASGRGVVKRCCHCCNGSPIPPRPKKPRQRKPTMDFSTH